MKPLHFGLLLVGVALVGGLAVKMTQAPPIPAAAPPIPAPAVLPSSPAVVKTRKPSPIPTIPQPAPLRTSAPEPVFDQPPQPEVRRSKPISVAEAKSTQQVKPTQWTPGRYESPAQPVAARQPELAKPVSPKPEPPRPEPPQPEAAKPEVNLARHVTLQPGMTIPLRLDQTLTSDSFQASLAEPLAVDGLVIAEKGARVNVRPGLASLTTSDGQRVAISTDPWTKPAQPSAGVVVRFRVASRLTIIERQIADR
jgi:hypothetical protein